MKINGHTRIMGVLGFPVKHTLSPRIHNFLIDKYRMNCVYIPMEVKRGDIDRFLKGISRIDNFAGINITVPYKVDVIKHLDRISAEASRLRAVNTVKIDNNRMHGFNTDFFGFKRSIELNFPKLNLKGCKILMLGAGGASKAAALALVTSGIKELVILNRTLKNALRLKNDLKKISGRAEIRAAGLDHEFLKKEKDYIPDLIVNTTSVGLKATDSSLINLKSIRAEHTICYDMIYNPRKTRFLRSALESRLKILNGLDMLILQALKSFSIWTGISLENELMRCLKPLREILIKEL
jgi:shikimate dehydrogenase